MSMPAPPGWNKTIEDLFEELERGERLTIDRDERTWALAYERSRLPAGTLFPRGDEIWEAVDQCELDVQYIFAAPAGFSGRALLAKGERVRITDGITEPQPIFVSFVPVRYDDLHDSLVPEDVRSTEPYTGYSLSARTAYFNEHFRIVETADP